MNIKVDEFWKHIKYFQPLEFVCKQCLQEGKFFLEIAKEFVEKLDCFRAQVGVPLIVDSGCRCPHHNLAIGGSDTSFHVPFPDRKTMASDIWSPFRTMHQLWFEAEKFDWSGLGAYPFTDHQVIHIDTGYRYSRWVRVKVKVDNNIVTKYIYLFNNKVYDLPSIKPDS